HAFVTFMQGFLSAGESGPRVNTWQGWAEQIVQLLRLYVSPTAHSAQLEEALGHLGQLDLLGEQISLKEWYRGVAATLATTPVATGEEVGVFIGDLLAARGVQFRAVIIPDLVEGCFPQAARQDPLLLDSERQHLGEVLLCDLPQHSRLNEAERLWFTLATQSAVDRLVLTYSRFDQVGGHAQVPSFYLLRVIEALSGQPASFADLDEWVVRVPLTPFSAGPPSKAIDALEFHLASVEQALTEGSPTPLAYLPTVAPFFSHALYAARQRCDTPELTACDGMIEDGRVRDLLKQRFFPAGTVLSASALETYARCPFHYFLNTVLGLTAREEPERVLTVQPRERGALLHNILHDFFVRLRQDGRFPLALQDRGALGLLLKQVAEEHFQIFARTKATGFRLLWELEQERMQERLAVLLAQACEAGGDFLPVTFEARFGTDVADEQETFFPATPVRFLLENGEEIGLRGRIDRVDLSADRQHARVLDYNTGRPIRGYFAGGMALQLPLYMFAARALRPELTWLSAEYVYVDHLSRGSALRCTPDTWPESLATLRQIVTALVQGMQAGWFFPAPEACNPCPFSVICGTQVAARAACKQNDPRLEWLRQVRTIA
ncbi:MAG: PD-(D/E)XK nuclease family protein, partial [Candidatus Binatia bacterium]